MLDNPSRQRSKPPFRADHVGSILRSAALKEARENHQRGELDADQLRRIEDREIETIVRKQEDIGLKLATDGEYRRSWWHFDFFWMLDGVRRTSADQGIQFKGVQTKADGLQVDAKLDFPADHPMLAHFRFLKATAKVMPKMTIPSPSVMHFRGGRAVISKEVYPDLDAYFADLAKTYRKAIKAFYDAGCRYLQLDDTVWAYLCSREEMRKARERGEDTDKLPGIYTRLLNESLSGRPADMIVTTHVCRGNFRSTWISEGGYEPVAEKLFGEVNYDGYFLEYDTERAGGFEPLRFVKKGDQQIVLGLVTSKVGTLEKKDDIRRRIDEATKFVALEQLCLSPQCGFASTEEGNVLAEEEQWAKLRLCVEVADQVWR